ncbi:TniB family NTP-binding protein [Ideonella sp. B7]|uniref:TniB family NTP-binding protein n=1 Tax=Ideonella benzenivorans TaxID=2831643 RepID=UPI001CED8F57|nr:TniB family NTP-binding protein [Ideonella benzenivorans]MCA6218567.1 TniB family NTP-binding protein [Ideonella benzenivorans]
MIPRNLVECVLISHSAFEEAGRRAEQKIDYVKYGGREPACLALIGESRTGKSRCIEGILRRHPVQRTQEGILSPVLAITVPSKPTVKSLAENFLRKLRVTDWEKGTEPQKTARLIKLLEQCGVVTLILDEFHHFYDKTSNKVQHHVADWLKNIVSEGHVALVASGLQSLQSVIDQNEQLAGRFGAPVVMPRFFWSNEEQQAEWLGILAGFDDVLREHFDFPSLCSEEMGFRFYCATGGLIGYLTNTLRQIVWNAIDDDRAKIRLQDFDRAYKQAIWVMDRRSASKGEVTPFDERWNANPNEAAIGAATTVGCHVGEVREKSFGSKAPTTAAQVFSK